jgi:hypothetical protein
VYIVMIVVNVIVLVVVNKEAVDIVDLKVDLEVELQLGILALRLA